MELPGIGSLGELKGKRVLVRAPLNVPIKNGKVENDFRLSRFLPTLTRLRERGARVIMMGHIGREPHESLKPVHDYLAAIEPVGFSEILVGESVEARVSAMRDGDALLLENTRSHPGEVANQPEFARALASLADCYVNDAFDASHRVHASVVGVPALIPHAAGPNLLSEIEHLSPAFAPLHPALFILAGAKFETKQPLVEKFLDLYDDIFVGGALAHDFFRAKGFEMGASLISAENLTLSHLLNRPHLMLPVDVVVQSEQGVRICTPEHIASDERIVDAGPETLEMLKEKIARAKFVLWNGPLGNYERGFSEGTEGLVKMLAGANANAILGGGDTIASVSKYNLFDQFSFVSTGGGAMLEFLLNGTLPGIAALKE